MQNKKETTNFGAAAIYFDQKLCVLLSLLKQQVNIP
jgi:hypothetical protein